MNKEIICSICKLPIEPDANGWNGTNNAEPINDGRCCHVCNDRVVLYARLNQLHQTRGE